MEPINTDLNKEANRIFVASVKRSCIFGVTSANMGYICFFALCLLTWFLCIYSWPAIIFFYSLYIETERDMWRDSYTKWKQERQFWNSC